MLKSFEEFHVNDRLAASIANDLLNQRGCIVDFSIRTGNLGLMESGDKAIASNLIINSLP